MTEAPIQEPSDLADMTEASNHAPSRSWSVSLRKLQYFRVRLSPSATGAVLAVVVYFIAAFYIYWPISLFNNTNIGTSPDSTGQVWNLAWMDHVLSHLVNPFFTTAVNYPFGVNLADNATGPLIGFILWPVTAIIGPIAATNVAFSLAFATAATSMFFVTRRLLHSSWAAFVAGLLFGFSPYMIGEGSGHVFLVFTGLVPIMLYLFIDIFGPRRIKARNAGLLLGLVCGLQIYLAPEILADAAAIVLPTVIVLALRYFRLVTERIRNLLVTVCWAFLSFIVLAGYPLWYSLHGTNHITGPAQPLGALDYHTDLFDLIVPPDVFRFTPQFLLNIGSHLGLGNISESGAYLGLPLLLALVAIVIWRRKSPLVLAGVSIAFFAYLLSLGPQLDINDNTQTITLPFEWLTHLPGTDSEVPGRYSLYVQLGASLLFAIGIAEALRRWQLWQSRRPLQQRTSTSLWLSNNIRTRIGAIAITCVALGCLIPCVPVVPYSNTPANVPPFFTSAEVNRIPQNSVLLAYPYPQPYSYYQAILWQAIANFRFQVLGGYSLIPGGTAGTPWPPALVPPVMQDLFDEGAYGIASPPVPQPTGTDVPANSGTFRDMRRFLRHYHVETVALQATGKNPELVVHYLTRILGRPVRTGGMVLWFSVPSLLKSHR